MNYVALDIDADNLPVNSQVARTSIPPHDKIASFRLFAPPTPQILKQPKGEKRKHLKTTKALILVCYSDGEILQVDTELDIYFIFDASKCQRKLQVRYMVCLLCVLLLWQTQQSLPQPTVCKMPPS